MKLVPTKSGGGPADGRSVTISTADRRLIGIKSAPAKRALAERKVRGVGVLEVDERRRTRIPADVGGRVESLFVNFAGQKVRSGEALVKLYAPDLFAAQTELLTLKKTRRSSSSGRFTLTNVRDELIGAARQRLAELGMTSEQIAELEHRGTADTRSLIVSPQSGTVTKMLAREGQYVKAGELVCEVADLSNVWLLTELFPEDATQVRYGQLVEARVTSLPGVILTGRVSYIDPMVNPKTKSVKVRIDIANPDGQLRPGDEARVEMLVPAGVTSKLYDEQLAGKWICPEHPEEIRSTAETCPRSGKALVRASEFGYVGAADEIEQPIVVPREAVLMAGEQSVVYVETEPGRFELRQVTLGAKLANEIVVLAGLEEQEQVAVGGNFLIDSQMQLVGNPSLIDVSRAAADSPTGEFEIELPPIGPIQAVDEHEGQLHDDHRHDVSPSAKDDRDWQLPPITKPMPVDPPTPTGSTTREHAP
jgi:Cu(I)/Ag(I) efflux system membrane fusion protein